MDTNPTSVGFLFIVPHTFLPKRERAKFRIAVVPRKNCSAIHSATPRLYRYWFCSQSWVTLLNYNKLTTCYPKTWFADVKGCKIGGCEIGLYNFEVSILFSKSSAKTLAGIWQYLLLRSAQSWHSSWRLLFPGRFFVVLGLRMDPLDTVQKMLILNSYLVILLKIHGFSRINQSESRCQSIEESTLHLVVPKPITNRVGYDIPNSLGICRKAYVAYIPKAKRLRFQELLIFLEVSQYPILS